MVLAQLGGAPGRTRAGHQGEILIGLILSLYI